jgi:hypothetical protein
MTSGRFFASVVIHEGEKMAQMVTDFLGDGVWYSSDYPHAESRFPESTNKVLAWRSLSNEVMRKMLWNNADKMLRRTVGTSANLQTGLCEVLGEARCCRGCLPPVCSMR